MELNERKTKLEAELFRLKNELDNIRNILAQKDRNYLLVMGKLIEINEQLAVPIEPEKKKGKK